MDPMGMGVALTTYKSWEPILQVIPHLPPFVSLTPSVFDAFKAPGAFCRGRCFEEFHEYEIPFLLIRGTLRIPFGKIGEPRGRLGESPTTIFFQQTWKWQIAHLETKHIFQDPIFHWTMIMGGTVMIPKFQSIHMIGWKPFRSLRDYNLPA